MCSCVACLALLDGWWWWWKSGVRWSGLVISKSKQVFKKRREMNIPYPFAVPVMLM